MISDDYPLDNPFDLTEAESDGWFGFTCMQVKASIDSNYKCKPSLFSAFKRYKNRFPQVGSYDL
jgi:hypothetical protein